LCLAVIGYPAVGYKRTDAEYPGLPELMGPPPLENDERTEMLDQFNPCRGLLSLMRAAVHRQTITDLIIFLDSKLTAMDGRPARSAGAV
jgi:hypothetical protein